MSSSSRSKRASTSSSPRTEGRAPSSIAFTFDVSLNEEQLDVFLRLMQAGGYSTPRALVLSAVQKQADHFDLDRPGVFLKRGKA